MLDWVDYWIQTLFFFTSFQFMCGLTVGLWTNKLWKACFAGVMVAGLTAMASASFGLHVAALVIMWQPLLSFVLFFAVPSVLGSLTGYGIRLRLPPKRVLQLSVLAGTVCFALLLIIGPAFNSSLENAHRAPCLSNLKQIGLALAMYADDYRGQLPPESGAEGLNRVYPKYIRSSAAFHCPKDTRREAPQVGKPLTENTCSYVYGGGIWQSATYTNLAAVAWDKPENHGAQGLNVLFNDGHVSWLTLEQWKKVGPRI